MANQKELFDSKYEDRLSILIQKQKKLMEILGIDAKNLCEKSKTKESRILALALMVELGEFIQELNWKPWKKTKKTLKQAKIKEELIDCLHFLFELMILWDLNASEIFSVYLSKMEVNLNRQKKGY